MTKAQVVTMRIVRVGITTWMIWGLAYPETGVWTAVVLSLCAMQAEAAAFSIHRITDILALLNNIERARRERRG